jgi:hypothetical protein
MAGKARAARMAIIEITTSSSISVNAARHLRRERSFIEESPTEERNSLQEDF